MSAMRSHSSHRPEKVATSRRSPREPAPVTAVIPAYNRERLVAEAIRSVRSQTVPVAEILVVDDGSTDRTAEVARSLGACVIRQPNQGVSAARNAGIRAASQEWVALLDSDDLWEPEKIEAQWRAVELYDAAGLVFTDRIHFDEETGREKRGVMMGRDLYRCVRREELTPGVVRCDPATLARSLFRGNFIFPSTVLARRDALLGAGLFDAGFGTPGSLVGQVEDREFFLRMVARTETLAVERSLVRYRVHGGAASQDLLRMQMGKAEVAERVFARPECYPAGAVEFFRRDQPKRYREAGILLMHEGRFPDARRVLWRSLRGRLRTDTLAALLIALGGPRPHRLLVRLKRRLGLPGLRRPWST